MLARRLAAVGLTEPLVGSNRCRRGFAVVRVPAGAVLVWEPGKKVPILRVPPDSDLQTGCPYKGFASYRDVVLDGRRHRGLFWSYQASFREVSAVKGYLAPYNERVDLTVDGHPPRSGPPGHSARRQNPARPQPDPTRGVLRRRSHNDRHVRIDMEAAGPGDRGARGGIMSGTAAALSSGLPRRLGGYRGGNWERGAGGARLAVGAWAVNPMTAQLMSTPAAP